MSSNVGEVTFRLKFDESSVEKTMSNVENKMSDSGMNAGKVFGDKWAIAAGNLIQKGISKTLSLIGQSMDKAINRADVLNKFPRMLQNLGYSAEEAATSQEKLANALDGLPTTIADAASATVSLVNTAGSLGKATSLYTSLNNATLTFAISTDDAASAMYSLTSMLQENAVSADYWKSVNREAPGLLDQIARSMGYTSDQVGGDFYLALQKGTVTMQDFQDKLIELDQTGNNATGMAAYSETVKDSVGGIGTALENVQSRIASAIEKIITEIGVDNIAGIIDTISHSIVEVGKNIAGAIGFVRDNWNIIAPVAGIVTSIAVGTKALTTAMNGLKAIKNAVPNLKALAGGFSKVKNLLPSNTISSEVGKIGSVFTKLADTIKSAITNIGEILKSLVNAIMEPIKAVLQGIGEALAGFFEALASPAVLMGAVAFAAVAASIAAAIWLIGSAVGAIMPVLTDLLNNIIMPIAQFIASTVLTLIDALTQAVVTLTQSALIPLGEFMVGSLVTILQTVSNAVTNLTQNAIIPLINTLSGAFVNVVRTVADLLTGVLNAALQGIAEIIKAVGDGFLKMGQAIKSALEGVQGVLNAFADLIRSIAAAAVAIVALVTGHSINYGSGYAHLDGYAEGGLVTGDGTSTSDSIPAMLSDGEYVINAKAARKIGYGVLDAINDGDYTGFYGLEADFASDYGASATSSGGGVTVYMTNQISNEMDANDIGRVLMESIRRAA